MAALLNDPEIHEEEIYKNLDGVEEGIADDDLAALEGEEGEEGEELSEEDGDDAEGQGDVAFDEDEH